MRDGARLRSISGRCRCSTATAGASPGRCVVAGTHVCLRWVRAKAMYDAIADHGVTHLCGAPIVMATLLNAPEDEKRDFPQRVRFNTAAAPPPEAVLAGMDDAGFDVTHLYGLTETYGPAVVNEWKDEWSALDPRAGRRRRRARACATPRSRRSVLDPETMAPVPADGETIGEVMFRGNVVMKGYHKNPAATEKALGGGWFRSGDLGVMHPTATSSSRTARRTSSSRAARTSPPSRSRTRSTSTRRWPSPRWSPSPTRNGARRPAPSSSCARRLGRRRRS
jgi:acyl-CoA synthetase (AMP-forming)/AMP-acid ligase II